MLFPEPAVDIVGKAIVGRGHYDVWRSRVRGVPEFGGELPVSTLREEIETPGEGQIRAMLTVAGNPVLSTPDGTRLGEAFEGLDFMAAVDIYLNETTRHADVVLPPTTALEREQYDLVFHTLAVRNTARFTPPVFEKPEGAMHDWEIFREIALRTAARLKQEEADGQVARRAGRAQPQPDDDPLDPAAHRASYDDARAAGQPGRCRPRPAAADDARPAADQGQADPPRPRPDRRRPGPAAAHHRRDAERTPRRQTASCC